ncbi:hypothetical protein [Actinoplanes palleronii]|uniref:Uncharacterized protein n=1 Tax=Actinoplanes palleronii TaxID=113570 RepID=A0ABQ4BA84_9ACTN|nr:hypothetical protein [Actinoplanes palleronii]GIE67500.1 hypothetical protein Apa02nite_036080 [Actinoplanes palleronii]
MRRRTLFNGAIITTGLLTVTGLGVAIANAASTPGSTTAAGGSQCEAVFLVTAPAGDEVGKLCTTVDAADTTINGVTVVFTPSSTCTGKVMLRVSGADATGAEFGNVETSACTSGAASAAFTPVAEVAADTFLCGTLLADEYTAAQACVAIS